MTTPAPGNGTTAKYEPPQNEQVSELLSMSIQIKRRTAKSSPVRNDYYCSTSECILADACV